MFMCYEEYDMKCKIHRFEDKLLRGCDYQEQVKIQNLLRQIRKELQQLEWKRLAKEGLR